MTTEGNPYLGLFTKANRLMTAAPVHVPAGIISETLPLAKVLFPDVDTSDFPVTVDEALTVPAVDRAVLLYSGIVSRLNLVADGAELPWLERSRGPVTAKMRKAYTVQDLIFHNESLWQVIERNADGGIEYVEHVDRSRWAVNPANDEVEVDGAPADQDDLIWFGGLLPRGGFLTNGRDSVRQYTAMSRILNNRVAVPEPVTLVKETEEGGLTAEEVEELMDDLAERLTNKRGGILFVPRGYDVEGFGAVNNANAMMIESRNAIRLDLANHLGIKASLLEAVADGSSDTYTNTLMVQSELLELSIKTFSDPIADRLSSDDITPEGVTVRFDYSKFDAALTDTVGPGTVPPRQEVDPE